jgi:hypothetical protein
MPKVRDDSLFCVFADRTGIYENHISFFDAVGQAEADIFERRTDQCRVELIHLTTESFNVYGLSAHNRMNIRNLQSEINVTDSATTVHRG